MEAAVGEVGTLVALDASRFAMNRINPRFSLMLSAALSPRVYASKGLSEVMRGSLEGSDGLRHIL